MSDRRTKLLEWTKDEEYPGIQKYNAELGDCEAGDGARFEVVFQGTCYRRGPWKLLIEIAGGKHHHDWGCFGCFDEADQPMRYYHVEESWRAEAAAIAHVLVMDRLKATSDDSPVWYQALLERALERPQVPPPLPTGAPG